MAEAKKFDTSMSVWGKLANLPDLAKAYLFQVRFFYDTESPLAHLLDADDLMIKARTATLPQKEFGELDTQYMGTKLLYPGKATISGTFDIQWDEFQDTSISEALHRWSNLLMNYDSTLKNLLPLKWRLYRVWPKTVQNVSLDQNGDSKITRSCTFSYSTFEVIYT